MRTTSIRVLLAAAAVSAAVPAAADENLFGYVKGAEPLPKGALEFYALATSRRDKGQGSYSALDLAAELEYGVTDKLAVSGKLIALSVDISGLTADGYLPKDEDYALRLSGAEAALKYNFSEPGAR